MPKMKLNPTLSVLLPVLVISVIILGVSTYLLKKEREAHSHLPEQSSGIFDLHQGEILPDFALSNLKDEKKNFNELKGKVTLINFWATWCAPCVEEMPSLNKLYEKLKDKGFKVLAINTDENPGEVLPPFLKSQKLTFPIFIDQNGEVATKFSINGLPFSILVDEKNKIIYTVLGDREWEKEEEEILKLLAK